MIFLLVAGIGAVAAGLLAILYGIPIKEFGFGNTMILSGVIGVCTGLLMLGFWTIAREFRALAPRLLAATDDSPAPRPGRDRPLPPLPAESIADGRRGEPAVAPPPPPGPMPISVTDLAAGEAAPVGAPAPDGRAGQPAPPSAATPEAETKPKRRNLLFSSMSRKERERKAAEDAAGGTATGEAPDRRTFDDAWPERARADATRRRTTTFADRATEAAAPDGPAAVTVLKSGVVDGMAYSLYSDGSIEAQMPEGMMRFASIDELRAHLEQRP